MKCTNLRYSQVKIIFPRWDVFFGSLPNWILCYVEIASNAGHISLQSFLHNLHYRCDFYFWLSATCTVVNKAGLTVREFQVSRECFENIFVETVRATGLQERAGLQTCPAECCSPAQLSVSPPVTCNLQAPPVVPPVARRRPTLAHCRVGQSSRQWVGQSGRTWASSGTGRPSGRRISPSSHEK